MVYRGGKEILLNRHEFEILVYLASHPGWVRSKEQIYEAVWTEEVMDYENEKSRNQCKPQGKIPHRRRIKNIL